MQGILLLAVGAEVGALSLPSLIVMFSVEPKSVGLVALVGTFGGEIWWGHLGANFFIVH